MPQLYKLESDARPGELGGPPFILGSFLRFPRRTYENWGITGNERVLRENSFAAYQDEFGDTSPAWMESVVEAAKRGGIENRPQMLRDKVGEVAAYLTAKLLREQGKVRVLDVGCGPGGSANAYVEHLKKEVPDYAERVVLTLLDLSRSNLWKAQDVMEERGFIPGKSMFPVHARDIDMLGHLGNIPQDVVINVAGIHANADIEIPIRAISDILISGEYFVSGDWHHGRWLHPWHTYRLLDEADPERFMWRNKGEFMDEFRRKVPLATQPVDMSSMDPADARAIEEIGKYWLDGWATIRKEKIESGILRPLDEQIVAEGHVPVKDYVEAAIRNLMLLDRDIVVRDGMLSQNPYPVVPGTNLNMVAVFRKAA